MPDLPGARGARDHLDAIGHEVGAVEPDPELADEARVLLPALRELLEERARPRARDRPQVAHELLFRHPDPVVLDRERAAARDRRGCGSRAPCPRRRGSGSVSARKRSLSSASEAFDTSSRRKISLWL